MHLTASNPLAIDIEPGSFLIALVAAIPALLVAVILFFDSEARTWPGQSEPPASAWRVWPAVIAFEVSVVTLSGGLWTVLYVVLQNVDFPLRDTIMTLLAVGSAAFILSATLLTLVKTRSALGANPLLANVAVWALAMAGGAAPIVALVCILRMPGAFPG